MPATSKTDELNLYFDSHTPGILQCIPLCQWSYFNVFVLTGLRRICGSVAPVQGSRHQKTRVVVIRSCDSLNHSLDVLYKAQQLGRTLSLLQFVVVLTFNLSRELISRNEWKHLCGRTWTPVWLLHTSCWTHCSFRSQSDIW